jgi:hypothetical protein
MFSTVYRATQKDFYARPYTSMWATSFRVGTVYSILEYGMAIEGTLTDTLSISVQIKTEDLNLSYFRVW